MGKRHPDSSLPLERIIFNLRGLGEAGPSHTCPVSHVYGIAQAELHTDTNLVACTNHTQVQGHTLICIHAVTVTDIHQI